MPIHVAGDGQHLMGFAGGASAELEGYHRRDVAGPVLDRGVVQQQLVVLPVADFQFDVDLVARRCALNDRAHVLRDPSRQTFTHGLRPFVGLTAAGWQGAIAADQVFDQLADVVGEVDVFGEPVDDFVGFGQRRAALEGQVSGQR